MPHSPPILSSWFYHTDNTWRASTDYEANMIFAKHLLLSTSQVQKLSSTSCSLNPLVLCSVLHVTDRVSHPYKTTGNVTIERIPWIESTVNPRFTNASIMNSSVYEQIFRTQSVSDDVLCLELRTRNPSTSWSDKLGVSASAVFVVEWSSGKYPESATPIGESFSCCVAFVHSNSLCLLLNFSVFCVFL